MPKVNSNKEIKMVLSNPMRLATFGANEEKSANASKGRIVIDPANALLIAKSSRIAGINEPTAVNGALKLAPIKIIPITNSQVGIFLCVFSKGGIWLSKMPLRFFSEKMPSLKA